MKNIIFVSHCLLNTASKVVMYNAEEMRAEEELRRKFILGAVERGVQLVQLPCPEFIMYGCRRWGHVSDQFDTPFFRAECRRLLSGSVEQLREYLSAGDRFRVLGIVGVDGSPSCGVDYTCYGDWGGNLSDRDGLGEVIAGSRLGAGAGIMMQELKRLLEEAGIDVPLTGLFAPESGKLMALLDGVTDQMEDRA